MWKLCGPLDGEEEARMENHLSCACNKDGNEVGELLWDSRGGVQKLD